MKNKKLIALLVAIATISPLFADTYFEKNCYTNEFGATVCPQVRPVEGTVRATGNVVEGTSRAAGTAVEETAKTPGRVLGGIFGRPPRD